MLALYINTVKAGAIIEEVVRKAGQIISEG